VISTQGAFEPTQICLEGLIPGSVSKVPKRRRIFSGCASLRLRIGEPQRPQKHRRFPGEDSHSFISSSPATNRNEGAGIVAPVPNAAPDAFRHWPQWQLLTDVSSPSISYRIPPQRQEPLSIYPPFAPRRRCLARPISKFIVTAPSMSSLRSFYYFISFTKLQSTNWLKGISLVILSRSLVSCTSRLTPLSEIMPSSVKELIEVS
jgi:hypothetical protein